MNISYKLAIAPEVGTQPVNLQTARGILRNPASDSKKTRTKRKLGLEKNSDSSLKKAGLAIRKAGLEIEKTGSETACIQNWNAWTRL